MEHAQRLLPRSIEDPCPRRHPDPHGSPQTLLRLRKRHERLRRKAARDAVQASWNGVLLVQKRRDAESAGGHHGGRARISPDPENGPRLQFLYYVYTTHGCPEGEQTCTGLGYGVSGEASQGEGVEGVAFARDEGLFDARGGANELDHGVSSPQLSRHAQRGDSVSSRAASCYQDSWPPGV